MALQESKAEASLVRSPILGGRIGTGVVLPRCLQGRQLQRMTRSVSPDVAVIFIKSGVDSILVKGFTSCVAMMMSIGGKEGAVEWWLGQVLMYGMKGSTSGKGGGVCG